MASGSIVGKIDEVQGAGNALIIRSSGEQIIAQTGDALCLGDTIVAGPGSVAILQTNTNFASSSGVLSLGPWESTSLTSTLANNVAPLLPSSNSFNPVDVGQPPNASITDIYNMAFSSPEPCFLAGTLIATIEGEVPVEELKIGVDLVLSDARTAKVLWIGCKTVQMVSIRCQPVRIRAGALGDGLPHTDLKVTADHGMVLDDLVINASALVNADTIDFVPLAELGNSFTVYHIETEHHDVILANGAPSETFIDAVGRAAFDNHQEYLDLYGAERIIPEMQMPRISSVRLMPKAIKDRLNNTPNGVLSAAV